MRRLTATLLLALLLSLSFAQNYTELHNHKHNLSACTTLENAIAFRNFKYHDYGDKLEGISVELWWEETLERAAAALLRATLIASGSSTDMLKLRHGNHSNFNKVASTSNIHTLSAQVALTPKLHVFLAPHAAASPACVNASSWSFYNDTKKLSECQFITLGYQRKHQVIVYIPREWKRVSDFDAILHCARRQYDTNVKMNIMYTERSNLTHFIRESNQSFLFLGTNIWSDSREVKIMQLAPQESSEKCHSLANNIVSVREHDGFLPAAEEFSKAVATFSPSLSELQNVINLAATNNSTIEEAACKWAIHIFGIDDKSYLNEIIIKAFEYGLSQIAVVIIVCEIEKTELHEYSYLAEVIGAEAFTKNLESLAFEQGIKLKLYHSNNCHDTDWLFKMFTFWSSKGIANQIAGVVLTSDMANAAAPIAEMVKLPLVTYDIGIGTYDVTYSRPAVRSAIGHVAHLEQALRRLLADCGWRRVAIISEPTRVSAALTIALQNSSEKLVVREVNVTSVQEIRRGLQKLLAMDARVFLVNTAVDMTATVLTVAQELNITRDAGFVWIVREFGVTDNVTAVLRPLSVSLRWRGDAADEAANSTLLRKLEMRWRGRPWPLHAAPLADATLTILMGVHLYKEEWFYPRRKDALMNFWNRMNIVKHNNIFGVKQKLVYDEHGVTEPVVYVEQWGDAPRPRILATWHADQWHESAECPTDYQPPSDGSVRCFAPIGDAFLPTCRDAVLLAPTTLVVLISTVLIYVAIRYSRKALMARDQRVKTALAERMLARRERVFAALASHLVDRSALELHQELGQGRFGVVRLGVLRVLGRSRRAIVVAAKALREDASPAEESEFLREACTLAALKHEHVVRFIGVCVVDGPPLLLMEHAFYSDLLRYLQTRRYLANSDKITSTEVGLEEKASVSADALTSLAQQAAAALAYISRRGLVHRDVRASNCLLDEQRSLKLADFGLARTTGTMDGEYACRRRGMFPVLWMAPESLASGVSSSASDVWSFGVLVFELVTLGLRPYGSQAPPIVMQHVLAGGQPQLPWDASAETRALVSACWQRAPEARPTAAQLAEWLSARRRALRPALAKELVEIDSEIKDSLKFGEPGTDVPALPGSVEMPQAKTACSSIVS